jgi:hypothetical protein
VPRQRVAARADLSVIAPLAPGSSRASEVRGARLGTQRKDPGAAQRGELDAGSRIAAYFVRGVRNDRDSAVRSAQN